MPPRYEEALREAIQRFGDRRQVTGIDIGPKYTEKKKTATPSIRLHVVAKRNPSSLLLNERFPKEIGGVAVDVMQRNYVPAIEGLTANEKNPPPASGRFPFLTPGMSVSHRLCPTGTLGLFVRDDTDGSTALLTNWHILADSSFARIGDPIMQPGAMDGGTVADSVATLRRWILDADGDAAIATVNANRAIDPSIPGIAKMPEIVRDPVEGETVVKCGRSTGVTSGIVEGRGIYFPIYRTRDRVAVEGFEIIPVDPENPGNIEISSNGDSGSGWLAKDSGDLVGLHFAGERDPAANKEVAIACFATRVFEKLSISLAAAS